RPHRRLARGGPGDRLRPHHGGAPRRPPEPGPRRPASRVAGGGQHLRQPAAVRPRRGPGGLPAPLRRRRPALGARGRRRPLPPAGRQAAVALVRALAQAQAVHRSGPASPREVEAAMAQVMGAHAGVSLDYATVVDPATFQPATEVDGSTLALLAARVGTTRLID